MRKNTEVVYKAWRSGRSSKPSPSIWTDGSRIMSYSTEIARVNGENIAFNAQKYSVTTSCQQSGLLTLLRSHTRPLFVYETEADYQQAVNA